MVQGQINLVPDSSFENYNYIPTIRLSPADVFHKVLPFWFAPTDGTPDYYNTNSTSIITSLPQNTYYSTNFPICSNFQYARTGNGCAAFGTGVLFDSFYTLKTRHEYIQTKLVQPLIENHYYRVSFYINISHCSYMAFSSLGAYISVDSIRQYYPNSYDYPNWSNYETIIKPQILNHSGILSDSINWVKISGIYKAKGAEQWVTLGHFNVSNEKIVIYDTLQKPFNPYCS